MVSDGVSIMLKRRIVVPSSVSGKASAARPGETCSKCGERQDLVFAGSVCGRYCENLDRQWASAAVTDWVLITAPGPSDKVHPMLQALKKSLDATPGRCPSEDETCVVPELGLVRYIYRNTTYAEMKAHWATADPPGSCRLGLATPDERDQMKSNAGTRCQLAIPLVRPARLEEIAEHDSELRRRRCIRETTAILEEWGFNDEFMPHEGVWNDQTEQRARQAYEAIRTRLGQLGLLEGSAYQKPLDEM